MKPPCSVEFKFKGKSTKEYEYEYMSSWNKVTAWGRKGLRVVLRGRPATKNDREFERL